MQDHQKKFKQALSYSNRTLASLQVQVDRQKKLLKIIRTVLPEPLAHHLQSCAVQDKKLLLYTESAAWASQLRFYSRAIAEVTRSKLGEDIQVTKVRIAVLAKAPDYEPPAPKIPSLANIGLIRESIKNTADSPLKTALLQLSRTLRKVYDAAAPD